MTNSAPTTERPARPAKPPRDQDPRNPVHRLTALLDEGTLELITPDDDSGMLAAVGQVNGTRVVAFCSDATVMGGAMGDLGCRVVVDAYHRAITDGVPIIGLWHSGGARLAEGVLSLHAVGRIFHVPAASLQLGSQATVHELTLVRGRNTVTLFDLVGTSSVDGRVDLRFGEDEAGEMYVMSKQDGVVRRIVAA